MKTQFIGVQSLRLGKHSMKNINQDGPIHVLSINDGKFKLLIDHDALGKLETFIALHRTGKDE